MNTHEGAVIHHSVTPQDQDLQSALNGINETHKARGFPISEQGTYIGYHFVISARGTVAQTRYDHEVGAHCYEEDKNFTSLGICLLGDFTKDTLTEQQREALINLLSEKIKAYKWTREDIGYHGQFKSTQCPGTSIKNEFNDIIEEAFLRTTLMQAPEWFKEEGYYDRAKAAGIQWVNGEAPEWAWKVLGADFKIKDHEQGANEAVPPTGNLKITVVIPEIDEHVKYCMKEIHQWLYPKIPTQIKIVEKALIPEWHLKSDSNRNLIKADWLQKNVEPHRDGAQILCLVVEPKHYKKKGTNGASFDYAYEKGVGQITWQKWTKGRQDKKYGGFAQNYQLAGTLRHEIVHALFQLTGFNEIDKERNDYLTHIYEKEKRFDELLDIIPFNKI